MNDILILEVDDSENSSDRIHISFDGVETVDDLLERIDDAVEKAKIVVNPAQASTSESQAKDPNNEPIRIKHGDVHKIEDLLLLVNNQPGDRRVILDDAPNQSTSISIQKKSGTTTEQGPDSKTTIQKAETPTGATEETPDSKTTVQKTETPGGTTKEKTEETPDSKTTIKKTETPEGTTKEKTEETPAGTTKEETKSVQQPAVDDGEPDQIHVNVDNLESVDDMLDRIDDAVKNTPVIIDTKPRDDDRAASLKFGKNQTDENTAHF